MTIPITTTTMTTTMTMSPVLLELELALVATAGHGDRMCVEVAVDVVGVVDDAAVVAGERTKPVHLSE